MPPAHAIAFYRAADAVRDARCSARFTRLPPAAATSFADISLHAAVHFRMRAAITDDFRLITLVLMPP